MPPLNVMKHTFTQDIEVPHLKHSEYITTYDVGLTVFTLCKSFSSCIIYELYIPAGLPAVPL